MQAIRNYRDLSANMQGELKKIDAGLRVDVKKKREQLIREKYQEHLGANLEKIKAGREHFTQARMKAADPFRALMVKTFKSDVSAGMAVVFDGLSLLGPEQQFELARELNHPALALKALVNIRNMDLEPESRMTLDAKVQELIRGHIDAAAIQDHAQVEMLCLECEAEALRDSGADASKVLGMGHRIDALKKVIATGELPKSERISALSHPDPLERMRAARKPVDA
jgi:hypothetical protein